ncbi:peptide chain release factor N(5)-glutamine methyltransferase [Candidatus Ruminimicrobium bovinum]|uniref:peptide chain release factor N(5)-glutamine methyltransferase n=1 Tax=Candidatus Ruminimicrobium bovinum TaxID=3242779 RepID=UPI0039B8BA8F
MKTVFNLLQQAEKYLTLHNIEEAKLDSEVLLCGVLNITRSNLFLLRDKSLTPQQYIKYQTYIERRISGEPVSYILEKSEFMGLNFFVNKNVLIPRQETEILVEEVIKTVKQNDNLKSLLDIGTGSGCIPVSVCKYCPDISAVAADISSAALEVAKQNAILNNVSAKIIFKKSDMFGDISKKFDIITSNPPYISEREFKTVQKELLFEPKEALVASDDGLFFYKIISDNLKNFLNENGFAFFELNSNISNKINGLFENKGYKNIKIIKDYSGLDRVLVIQNG